MKQITIDITAEGAVTVEVDGVKGRQCLDLTEQIERALGNWTARTSKPAMHQPADQGQGASAGRGGQLR